MGVEKDKWWIWAPRAQNGQDSLQSKEKATRPQLASSQGLISNWTEREYKTGEKNANRTSGFIFMRPHKFLEKKGKTLKKTRNALKNKKARKPKKRGKKDQGWDAPREAEHTSYVNLEISEFIPILLLLRGLSGHVSCDAVAIRILIRIVQCEWPSGETKARYLIPFLPVGSQESVLRPNPDLPFLGVWVKTKENHPKHQRYARSGKRGQFHAICVTHGTLRCVCPRCTRDLCDAEWLAASEALRRNEPLSLRALPKTFSAAIKETKAFHNQ